MLTRRRTTLTAAVTIALLLTTGCSSRPEKADTVGGPVATSSATASPAQEDAPVVQAVALTQEQIDAALLTQEDMPAGWTAMPVDGDTDPEDAAEDDAGPSTFDPPACEDVASGFGDTDETREPVATGKVGFGSEELTFLSQDISTWDSGLRSKRLDDLVEALSACPQWTETTADGTSTTSTITALDLPNHGDRTLAVRMATTAGSEAFSMTFTLDLVVVASGSTSITVLAGGLAPVDPAVLSQVVATAVQKVDAVA